MKISRNWLNNYLVSNKSNEDLVNLFTQLGLECTFKKIKLLPDDIRPLPVRLTYILSSIIYKSFIFWL